MKKSFYNNAFSNILTLSANAITPLIFIPILTKGLGLDTYGKYMALFGLVFLFVVILDFGMEMYLTKEVVAARDDKEGLNLLFSFFILIKSIGVTLSFPLLFLLIPGVELYTALLCWCLIFLMTIRPVCFYCGLELYSNQSKIEIAGKILMVFIVLLLDFEKGEINKALEIQVVGAIFMNILFYFYLRKYCTFSFDIFSKTYLVKRYLKSSFGYYAARLFVNIYIQSSTYLVSIFLKNELVALYSIALQLYKLGQAVIGAVSRVLYTSTIKSKDYFHVIKITLGTLFVQLLILPIVYYWGAPIVSFLLGVNGEELMYLLMPLYCSLLFVTISSYWGYPVLVSLGGEKYAHIGIFLSSACYFIVFFISVMFFEFSLFSAIVCIVVSDVVACFLRMFFAVKLINFKKLLL